MDNFNSIVFDIDATLGRCENHEYHSATVIEPIANKLRKLHAEGYQIVLYSARGSTSRNGDMKRIETEVRPEVELWLRNNNIPYDELRFGKPLGAIYIDDKSCDLATFLSEEIDVLTHSKPDLLISGASGLGLKVVGDQITKTCHTAQEQVTWLDNAREMGIEVPMIHMVGKNSYTMERLSGISLSNCVSLEPFVTVMDTVDGFRGMDHKNNVYFSWFIDKIEGRLAYVDDSDFCDQLMSKLRHMEGFMNSHRSFCHEDMLFGNVIYTEDKRTVFLDPTSTSTTFNSWLMDVSKMLVSADSQYERDILGYRHNPVMPFVAELIKERYSCFMGELRVLQACRLIQLLHYIDSSKHTALIEKAKELIDEF